MNQDDLHNDDNDDDFEDDSEFEGVYVIDEETADLLAAAIGVLHMAASIQMGDEHSENIRLIAQEIQERFAIERDSMTVEEHVISDPETGEEEILYRPKGGVFGDESENDEPEETE